MDNGDRTVLVNPELGGVTLGWTLTHTAQDELFAAIEGTAFHTRVILERMAEYGVPIERVLNGGGIPQKNAVLNRVYADVLNKPVIVPKREVTSLGSAIFAFLAAGVFRSIEEAQARLCPEFRVFEPDPRAAEVCDELYALWRKLYFVTAELTGEEIATDYEGPYRRRDRAGARRLGSLEMPAMLVAGHAPFSWGRNASEAVRHAVILEEVAALALASFSSNAEASPISRELIDKHFCRKHGASAYYGQR